jgi:hypothetical protein
MAVNLNSDIGAGDGTNAAPDAAGRIVNLSVKVSTHRYIFGHRDNLLGADLDTQLAAFAVVLIYRDSRHLLSLPSLPRLQQKTIELKHRHVERLRVDSL